MKLSTPNEQFDHFYNQAIEEMAALRLPITGTDELEYVPAAGLPWFVSLFGRDSLIVSLQNALVYPDFSRGALKVLGQRQASWRDDYRDAEPGKIMHELRTGDLHSRKLASGHFPGLRAGLQNPLDIEARIASDRSTAVNKGGAVAVADERVVSVVIDPHRIIVRLKQGGPRRQC